MNAVQPQRFTDRQAAILDHVTATLCEWLAAGLGPDLSPRAANALSIAFANHGVRLFVTRGGAT